MIEKEIDDFMNDYKLLMKNHDSLIKKINIDKKIDNEWKEFDKKLEKSSKEETIQIFKNYFLFQTMLNQIVDHNYSAAKIAKETFYKIQEIITEYNAGNEFSQLNGLKQLASRLENLQMTIDKMHFNPTDDIFYFERKGKTGKEYFPKHIKLISDVAYENVLALKKLKYKIFLESL